MLRCPGYVEGEKIEVGSRVGGRIEKVFVEEGSEVKAGQELVKFETAHLEAQLDEAQHRVARLKAALDKAVAGPRPQEIERARRQLDAAMAEAKNAADQYKRGQETGVRVITREQLEQLETHMKRAAAEEQARRQELSLLEAGTRAEDLVIAQRELEEAQAHELVLKDQLNEGTVRAPVDAVVERCDAQPGDLVAPGVPVVVLVRPDELWVRIFVPTARVSLVHPDQKLRITLAARPGEVFEGTVVRVDRATESAVRNASQSTGEQSFGVKIRLPDGLEGLRPGMPATALVPLTGS
ncbi:MAG: efflux RND transporter periplasmic adaptor subunit [Planctomycetia bacterium]|nr:efflux RND transporter periplasmic adaptor subunit [Planctomycetia bacterium]